MESVARQGNARAGRAWIAGLALALAAAGQAGCGINKSRLATEQLVVSDAVDRAVASIDFSPLSGQKVYFDTKYVDNVKLGAGANVEYVVSSLRQQMLAYDCRLQEKPESADYIVEARVGVLGYDGHEITYGVPGNAALGTASVLLSNPVPIPALPELSLGRRNHQSGAAKIGLFAYDRETREPVWQAGVTKGASEARDLWIFGMGPYQQRSSVRRKTKSGPLAIWQKREKAPPSDPASAYASPLVFRRAVDRTGPARPDSAPSDAKSGEIATVSHEQPVAEPQQFSPASNTQPISPAAVPPTSVPPSTAP
jgi:hypothetical protein